MSRFSDITAYGEEKAAIANAGPGRVEQKSLGDAAMDAFAGLLPENEQFGQKSGGTGSQFLPLVDRYKRRLIANDYSPKFVAAREAEARAYFELGLRLCETPIEKRMLPHLMFEIYGSSIQSPIPVCNWKANDQLPPSGPLFIVPQLAFVRFRLDFALVRRLPNRGLGIVAVECDGDDFHFAQRDTLRDGWLASFQIRTIRASGKDIYKRPEYVSSRVAEAVMELAG